MAKTYDYYEAVENDIEEYIKNEIDLSDYEDKDELVEYLNETLWVEDSVTGNGSGSYTFDTVEAEQNLGGNWDLAGEMMDEFGMDVNPFEKGAEWVDVSIRCYILSQCISAVLDKIYK